MIDYTYTRSKPFKIQVRCEPGLYLQQNLEALTGFRIVLPDFPRDNQWREITGYTDDDGQWKWDVRVIAGPDAE